MSEKRVRRMKLSQVGSVMKKHASSDTQGEDNSSSSTAIVKVKVEKEEPDVLLTDLLKMSGIQKRKRLTRGGSTVEKSRRFAANSENSSGNKKSKLTTRWNNERIDFAEKTLVEVLKEKGASFESPVPRHELRSISRKKIGDTGLLDHLLKHVDGNVTPDGADRFRRCYNTEGTMEYWLETADLVKIKRESGIPDPSWVPPSWWKIQNATHESSSVSSKLKEEIEQMKSDIKELVSKQKLTDHADSTEKLFKDFTIWRVNADKQIEDLVSWRVKTDKQFAEISNSLTSTQTMFKELMSWKDKVEQQLVGISNSPNNQQANGSTSFSPAPESWENIFQSASLNDLTGNGFEPWDDFIGVLPDVVRPDTDSLPPNACKRSFQDQFRFEEQSLINTEMQRTESCITRGDSRSSNQDKADITPGSSITVCPRPDIDDPIVISQETLKELVNWKAKAEQQLKEMSNAIIALQGKSTELALTVTTTETQQAQFHQ
uniref:Protein DYAD n=1 Tax=Noccaea caerulescens TaxID=107243 RepID=A0A1J3ITT7_NOCCA